MKYFLLLLMYDDTDPLDEIDRYKLKDLCHPAFLAHAVSSLAFVVVIFMGHANGDNKVQLDPAC